MALLKKAFFLFFFFAYTLVASEPSAYGAGDLQSQNPYGLTPEEKVLLETKHNLKQIEVKTNTQENKVNSLRERIDGLQTIIEGLAKKNHQNKLQILELSRRLQKDEIGFTEYEKRIENLSIDNAEAIRRLETAVRELNVTMQEKYVTKEELQEVVDSFNKFKRLVAQQLKDVSNRSNSLDRLPKAQILKDAYKYYKKKNYAKAVEYYKYLLAHNYKPARSSYMLGEIYYYKKDYANAIAYFKESAKRYSKASWMPTLMLHTAVAMQKTGDTKNARKFFQAILAKYPNTKEAKTAQKYLK